MAAEANTRQMRQIHGSLGKYKAAEANKRQLRHILDSSNNGMAMVWQVFDVMAVKATVNGSISRSFFLAVFMLTSAYKSTCWLADLWTAPLCVREGGWLKAG